MINDTAYFDNAATTFPKPECVYKTMDFFYRNYGANVGRGQYKLASVAANTTDETRRLIKKLFHCSNKEVIFAASSTISLNLVIRSIVKRGMTVYISPFEHNAVTRTLHRLESKYDLKIIQLAINKNNWEYPLDVIAEQFGKEKPDAVIISHVSNICGLIAPIHEISHLAKKYSATTVIDMSQSAGLVETDLSSLDIDYAVIEGHKTLYGPFGISATIASERKIKELTPLIYGGTGIDSANQNMPDIIPRRFEAGSHNILAISGLNAALKWILEIGVKNIYEKDRINHQKLLDVLKKHSNVKLVGPAEPKICVGIVSCVFSGFSADEIGNILSKNGIAVRTGLDCSPYAHKCIGTFPAGTVRFSVSYFNTDDDYDKLESVLCYIEENS